jgi:hypothetical protein
MISKINVVNGTLKLMRISGLTTQGTPDEIKDGLQVLDDYMAELSTTLETGYIQPASYGESDPNDDSGLTLEMAGPIKKALLLEFCSYFGKDVPMAIAKTSADGMRALEQLLVNVAPSQHPATLPIGSGNEWPYSSGRKFYPEPISDDNPEYYYAGDSFKLKVDWSAWLDGETLSTVVYSTKGSVLLSNESVVVNNSEVTVAFTGSGQSEVCATATNSSGLTKVQKYVYAVSNC